MISKHYIDNLLPESEVPANNLSVNRRQFLAVLILLVWISVCAGVLWWFQFQHMNSLSNYWATFSGSALQDVRLKPEKGKALVVHFVDSECPCSRFSSSHIAKLESLFGAEVEFLHHSNIPLNDLRKPMLQSLMIPAGPAVAIWNNNGDLAYFGPYSSGSFCGQGRDFVSTTLASLERGVNPLWINQEAVGCFCQWPSTLI